MRTPLIVDVGQVFGKWTVIKYDVGYSLCRCDCGTEKSVRNVYLLNGMSTKCRSCVKGDSVGYDALHLRVVVARGKPQKCEECGETEGRMEWANLSGNYYDVNDYARLCVSCHKRLDHERRVETKTMTSERNTLNGGFRHSNRAILTEDQVLEAKQLRKSGWTWIALGKRYGVVGNTVKSAVDGKNWKHLKEKDGVQ